MSPRVIIAIKSLSVSLSLSLTHTQNTKHKTQNTKHMYNYNLQTMPSLYKPNISHLLLVQTLVLSKQVFVGFDIRMGTFNSELSKLYQRRSSPQKLQKSMRFCSRAHRLNRRNGIRSKEAMARAKVRVLHANMKIKNLRLYMQNKSIIEENEKLRRKAFQLDQENRALLSQLQISSSPQPSYSLTSTFNTSNIKNMFMLQQQN